MNATVDEHLQVPEVTRTPEGAIRVLMTPDDAQRLGHILAHYGALIAMSREELEAQAAQAPPYPADAPALHPPAGYDTTVWEHTRLSLYRTAVLARGRFASVSPVAAPRSVEQLTQRAEAGSRVLPPTTDLGGAAR